MNQIRLLDSYDTTSIASLSDGIFGVALTLLVLDVHLLGSSMDHLAAQLVSLWPKFFSFGLTFIVVAAYWIAYHRIVAHIVTYNRALLFRNFAFLAFVVLSPFPTSLIGEGHFAHVVDVRVAWIAYACTLALVGLTLAWLWHGATSHRLADPTLGPSAAKYLLYRTLVAPAVFVLSIGAAFLSTSLAPYILLLIFPAQTVLHRRYAHVDPDPD